MVVSLLYLYTQQPFLICNKINVYSSGEKIYYKNLLSNLNCNYSTRFCVSDKYYYEYYYFITTIIMLVSYDTSIINVYIYMKILKNSSQNKQLFLNRFNHETFFVFTYMAYIWPT
jgi:hypothetical protein